jgi:predicted DNA-binding transcriptional regulator AlpA
VEIVGTPEMAEMFGVTTRTAKRYAARKDFPKPIGKVGRVRVWRKSAVERWAAKTLPLKRTGRPPKKRRK